MQENIKKAMSVINRSANRLRAQMAKVNEQINVLYRERSKLMQLPVLSSDFARSVCTAIDVMAEEEGVKFFRYFRDQTDGRTPHVWGSPTASNMLRLAEGRVKMIGLISHQVNFPDPDLLPLGTAIFMFRDAIKKAVTESIETVEWSYDNAKPLDEINARVAEIDQEIEQLEAELKELRATAREIGIDVSDARLSAAQQSDEMPTQD